MSALAYPKYLLELTGIHARAVLLAGLIIVPFLPLPHGVLQPLLPVLISLLIGLALCRLDLASILADLANRRFILALTGGLVLFQVVAAAGVHLAGAVLGLGPVLILMAVAFMASPPLTSAPNLALILGYDARLTLFWMLIGTFLAPVLMPAALLVSGLDLPLDLTRLALKVAAMLIGGVVIGAVLRAVIGANRIAAEGKAMDGAAALAMLGFLFPALEGVLGAVLARPDLAIGLAVLALALNLGANLAMRWLAGRFFDRPRARALGLVFGNRNISFVLAVFPPDPTVSLFVAVAQIPIYASPMILRAFDGPMVRAAAVDGQSADGSGSDRPGPDRPA
ncbi:hypothetical protein [Paracoccus pacificus]|uniref:Bile acid:Na+ symporter, BASS family n=1 Tax=Paracoccus pacificus TaxID=1463598 RepID=A0ABW4RCA3_9RHOB